MPPAATAKLVQEAKVRKAVTALVKHLSNEAAKKKNQLLEEDEMFHLVVALKKAPEKGSHKPIRIEIPNPIYSQEAAEVCLFVKDHDGTGHKEAKARVRSIENSGVQKVIGLTKLKANYFTFEQKRKLCDSYELFLADDRILPSLPKLLGKSFFKKKKQPVPVNLARKDWGAQIQKAINATHTVVSEGNCMSIKVAKSLLTEEEIVQNVMAVVAALGDVVPRKFKNVQALYLKTGESVALPLYAALPDDGQKIEDIALPVKRSE